MGLEDTLAEAIVMGMDELAGNPQRAVAAAVDCRSAAQWIKQETTKLAFIGGAEMVVPGLHAFTIPTGVSYLLHKMGYISWGIGALKGAYVIETEAYSDLRNVLALWANEGDFDASLLEHLAISLEALEWALSAEGQAAMPALLTAPTDATTLRTYHILQKLAENLVAGDERGGAVLESMRGKESAAEILASGKEHVEHRNIEVMLTRPLGRKISRRLAYKLASRIGTRIPARMIVGFLPVAGAVANAFLNVQTIRSMADSAEKYYDRRLRLEHLEEAIA
ncbi:MAG: hypothetical protein OXG78_10530 [Chloroflexi bacterium]|nr:hypothetical protein [Chloroflexota bacterium]